MAPPTTAPVANAAPGDHTRHHASRHRGARAADERPTSEAARRERVDEEGNGSVRLRQVSLEDRHLESQLIALQLRAPSKPRLCP